jgi:hypothetical protein
MDWTFYCCVDVPSLERHWRLPLGELRRLVLKTQFPNHSDNWALLDREAMEKAFIPQVDRLVLSYGEEKTTESIFEEICKKLSSVSYGLDEARKSGFNHFLWKIGVPRNSDLATVDDYYRIFDLYKGLVLINREGENIQPIKSVLIENYFSKYLKYFEIVRDHLRYDGSIRKNRLGELKPSAIDLIGEEIWHAYEWNWLCDFPHIMDAKDWKKKWEKLDGIPSFWEEFHITNKGNNRKESADLQLSISLADEDINLNKGRIRDKEEIIQNFLEARSPKRFKIISDEYSGFVREQLKKIGRVAEYSLANNLSLIKYDI